MAKFFPFMGLAAILLVVSSAPAQPAGGLPEAEQERLVAAHNRWAAGLRSLRASGRARVGAPDEKTRAFDFSMVLGRPGSARVQGRWGSLASLFDLTGDAAGWTLYLPRERSVVRSSENDADAGLLLPPVELISVLLPAGIPPADLRTRGTAAREGDAVKLVVPPGHGGAGSAYHRVLRVDPETGVPRSVEIRRSTQLEAPILVAHYRAFEGGGVEAFPTEVEVEIGTEGQWARFGFNTVRINTDVEASTFALNVPAGTRELTPSEVPDFLPEEEAGADQ